MLVFYVLSMFLVLRLPWNDAEVGSSPFIGALDRIGIPGSADIMNAIVVTAVLSCLNSGIYTGSRMLFALSRRGYAPKGLVEVNRRGVPVRRSCSPSRSASSPSSSPRSGPDSVFLWLVNSSGAVALFCYVLIAVSPAAAAPPARARGARVADAEDVVLPVADVRAIAAMVAVIGPMALVDDVRAQLWWSLASLAVVVGARVRAGAPGAAPAPRAAARPASPALRRASVD